MAGIFRETLPDGGTLEIDSGRWRISYCVPAADRRRTPKYHYWHIWDEEVPQAIQHHEEAFAKMLELAKTLPPGGSLELPTGGGLTIFASHNAGTIRLNCSTFAICTQEALLTRLNSYRYAMHRAPEIQQTLRGIQQA